MVAWGHNRQDRASSEIVWALNCSPINHCCPIEIEQQVRVGYRSPTYNVVKIKSPQFRLGCGEWGRRVWFVTFLRDLFRQGGSCDACYFFRLHDPLLGLELIKFLMICRPQLYNLSASESPSPSSHLNGNLLPFILCQAALGMQGKDSRQTDQVINCEDTEGDENR